MQNYVNNGYKKIQYLVINDRFQPNIWGISLHNLHGKNVEKVVENL